MKTYIQKFELKKLAAKSALSYLKPNLIVGLGAGSTISYLIEYIVNEIEYKSSIKFVTPSLETEVLLHQCFLNYVSISQVEKLDLYFDGCDQVDEDFNALKSGGGIHLNEKICASMANEFILLVDHNNYVSKFDATVPLCIPNGLSYVLDSIKKTYTDFGPIITVRKSDKKAGFLRSDNSNFLINVSFKTMPDLEDLNTKIKMITGVVEHYFIKWQQKLLWRNHFKK
ncbi:ribose 5-phosphate isomerase A [Epilithonimonas sp.]|uniref:ribose 5-phosphate isomerase A n=1 Tax=Epilithonimonas sp. TaxID=2894511 RepID=UPI0028AE2E49|nr:ribose 5-phosphate isomerase A [Epilithonimonas sp.]